MQSNLLSVSSNYTSGVDVKYVLRVRIVLCRRCEGQIPLQEDLPHAYNQDL